MEIHLSRYDLARDIMSEFVEYTEPEWRGLNMRNLKVDQAYLVLTSKYAKKTHLYTVSRECYTCPFTKLEKIQPEPLSRLAIPINVQHSLKFKLFESDQGRYAFDNETSLCEFDENFLMREFGVYNFTVTSNGTCNLETDKEGVNVNLSLLSMFILISLILGIARITWCAWKTYRYETDQENAASTTVTETTVQKTRMRSLDVFRGIAIVLMIFVNSGGGGYWWIDHAPWNGLHLADVVFPFFLWIMGVCIPISVRSQLRRGLSKLVICRRMAWRSIKLFLIGVCLNSLNGPQMENLRVMGVLQRFGVAYFVCGVLHTIFTKKEYIVPQNRWSYTFFELILFRGELMTSIALIIINLGIIFGLNVPGCGRGYLGPGGKHNYAQYSNCTGGAIGYIDLQILGNNHIYQHPTAKYVYDALAFDPEGVFGCLLTIVHVFLGILCGNQILLFKDCKSRLQRWIACSIVLGLLGGILCGFTSEDGAIPLNKNLWSLSFVFVTTSLAFAVLSVLYYVIDVKRWYNGFPFVESGMNAIIMYVGHTIVHKTLPWHWRIGAMNTHFVLLLESIWNTSLWVLIALYLDAKKLYYSL